MRQSELERAIVPSAAPDPSSPQRVAREFRALLESGVALRASGRAKRNPRSLLAKGYAPKFKIEVFHSTYYLSALRQNPDIRFFVAYVRPRRAGPIFPRIFYKDVSLIWRSASHFIRSSEENWIGKGDVKPVVEDGVTQWYSAEETTDLPLEIQNALETLIRGARRIPHDDVAISLVLRRGPDYRVRPYRDFREPRRRAAQLPGGRINGGRPVARFRRKNDPSSLVFVKGFEPDFAKGVLESHEGQSRLYGGALRRYRVLSTNRRIQFLFFAAPRHAWMIPPQATTTEIMSYGVRTVDVEIAEDACIPGYEYHFIDDYEDPPRLFTQIPKGYAGAPSEVDPSRADASAWLDKLPVIREFRRKLVGRR